MGVRSDGRPVVAINALSVNPTNAGSRTMYTELIPALARVAPHLHLLLICHAGNRELYDAELDSVVVDLGSSRIVKPVIRRSLYDLLQVRKLVRGRADVLVTPSNIGPAVRPSVPQVGVCAAHLVLPSAQRAALPERMPWIKVQYLRWPYRRYLRGCDQVLGISDYVAQGLVAELGVAGEKVRSMPLGVNPPPEGPTLEGRGDDILFVGTLYQYKGGHTAIRAFAACRDRLPAGSRLVLAGKDHAGEAARLVDLSRELGVSDAVDVRGSVPYEELLRLFRTSGVLLMPSLCEGFGLPVAEAMGYGLPVICADATALTGVAGGAAALVPPGDVAGFSEALVGVLGDPARRRAMAEHGVARAAELTWEYAAEQLRDAIDDALAGGNP